MWFQFNHDSLIFVDVCVCFNVRVKGEKLPPPTKKKTFRNSSLSCWKTGRQDSSVWASFSEVLKLMVGSLWKIRGDRIGSGMMKFLGGRCFFGGEEKNCERGLGFSPGLGLKSMIHQAKLLSLKLPSSGSILILSCTQL